MDSANFYPHNHQLQKLQQQQEQQQLVYSSLASSSSSATVLSTVNDQWNPSMILDGDDFNRYMNEILPNSKEYFWPKNINLENSLLEVDHEATKSCDLIRSYVHLPQPNKGIVSDCFRKLSDMNDSILKNSYIKNGHQDGIDLNENLWIESFSHDHTNQKLSTDNSYSNEESFDRFVGVAPIPPNYISCCTSESTDQQKLYAFTSLLPFSPSLPLATTEMLNCRNYDEGCTQSFQERMSSSHCHVQQSSASPSNSSNKTSISRKEVSRTKNPRPTPSQEVVKRPRVAPHSSCPTLKVRKEKLGDRIAALHRLVSPFCKTDTASVLTEAIGYIQFLHDQIQTLSMSYSKSSRSNSCLTTRGEFLSMKDKKDQQQRPMQDLRSRGLCLVPLAFTSYVCCSYNGSI